MLVFFLSIFYFLPTVLTSEVKLDVCGQMWKKIRLNQRVPLRKIKLKTENVEPFLCHLNTALAFILVSK